MEAAYGLCMLAATADDVETTRKRTLAFSGRMRVVMTDAWKRLKAACAQHEQRCVAVAERNHELAKCGFPPTYRTPRPPLMAVGIQVDCGDAYIMHTDTIEGDNDEDMIRYELECRGEHGLNMPATTSDDVETTRKSALAFSGRMRAAMRDTWKRLEAVCAQYEQQCATVAERNRALAKCGSPPACSVPRPPRMVVRVQADGGDTYVRRTDTIEGDNDEDMIRYELECRGEYGLTESLPDTAVPIRIDRYHVGEVVRQNARREHAVNLAYSL